MTRSVYSSGYSIKASRWSTPSTAHSVLPWGVASYTRWPWFAGIRDALNHAGLAVEVFSAIDANPSSEHVSAGLLAARGHRADGLVALGGGSAMDAGKCIALLANNPNEILKYENVGDNWQAADGRKILTTIAIPTTAGTGS